MNSNSKVQLLIDQATSNELSRPDQSLNVQVCQEIQAKPDNSKLAAAQFKKRFATKEPKVIALTLELLDQAMSRCGNPLHVQIGSKDFMNVLVVMLNTPNLPPPIVQKVLGLIQKWGIKFEKDKDILPLFSDVYQALKQRGVAFPELKQEQPVQPAQSQKKAEEPPHPKPQSKSSSSKNAVSQKYQKLLQDMNLVKGNINLTNMMIDTARPVELESSDNPINDLIRALKDMEAKLFELIATLENEEMMKVCLLVNDDLHKTFQRYEKLKRGKKPEVFIPGESSQVTTLVPTTVYEKPEVKAQRAQNKAPVQQQTVQQQSRPQQQEQKVVEDLFDFMSSGPSTQQQVPKQQPPPNFDFNVPPIQQQPVPQQKPAADFFAQIQPFPQAQQQQPPMMQQQPFGGQQPMPNQFMTGQQFPPQQMPQQMQPQMQPPKANNPLDQLNQIMKNMQEMTDRNKAGQNQPGQYGTNMMGPGAFATGMNPMMNQFMTGMPGMMPPPGGMLAIGAPPGMPGQFASNMMPPTGGFSGISAMGTGISGFGPSAGPSQPPSGMGNNAFSNFNQPSHLADSFKKDGFNIMGREPVKKVDEEGAKEFAELFSLADNKIKDRAHEKPRFDLEYKPTQFQQQQTHSNHGSNLIEGMGGLILNVQAAQQQQQKQNELNDLFGNAVQAKPSEQQQPANIYFGGNQPEQLHTEQQQHNQFDDIFGNPLPSDRDNQSVINQSDFDMFGGALGQAQAQQNPAGHQEKELFDMF